MQRLTVGKPLVFFAPALLAFACDNAVTTPEPTFNLNLPNVGDKDPEGPPIAPFAPVDSSSYLRKVKALMTGAAASPQELAQLQADPGAMRQLVNQWFDTPVFEQKMRNFFELAFQQRNFGANDFADQFALANIRNREGALERVMQNARESFARTAWTLVKEGKPFTETMTTRRFQMTTALMYTMAYHDERHVDNKRSYFHRRIETNAPGFNFDTLTVHRTGPEIPLAESTDPSSPNFMHFRADFSCPNNPATVTIGRERTVGLNLFEFMLGFFRSNTCGNAKNVGVRFSDSDFNDWRWVTVRHPNAGEETTVFYDVIGLRNATELVLHTPRVGFFSTMAFFANWPTNEDNEHRVTANQALIVALGRSFDGEDTIAPGNDLSLDKAHADPTTSCYSCHVTLDPMRQVFRQAYAYHGHDQDDPAFINSPGEFAVDGVRADINSIEALGNTLTTHPRLPRAWVHKLCYYANAVACSDDDPEVDRIANAFSASGFDFRTLIVELFSSPLVTHAQASESATQNGTGVGIARRFHWCTTLGKRLEMPTLCDGGPGNNNQRRRLSRILDALPDDDYARGNVAPIAVSDTSLFFRSATQNTCISIASYVVDAGTTPLFSSTEPDAAIATLVNTLMALPSGDPREADAHQILKEHFDAALLDTNNAKTALESTFVLACTAPSTISTGL